MVLRSIYFSSIMTMRKKIIRGSPTTIIRKPAPPMELRPAFTQVSLSHENLMTFPLSPLSGQKLRIGKEPSLLYRK